MNAARLHEVEKVVERELAAEQRIKPRGRAVIVGEDEGGLFARVMRRTALEGHLRGEAWRTRRNPPTREERAALIEMADAVATFRGLPVLVVGRDGETHLLAWEGLATPAARGSKCRAAIRDLLTVRPTSGRVLREELAGFAETTINHTLSEMRSAGEIEPTGRDGHSYVWRLVAADRAAA